LQPSAVERLADDPSSRKQFLRKMGGTGAAASFAVFAAACGQQDRLYPNSSSPEAAKNPAVGGGTRFGEGDIGIVNFATYLEYFEADFYDRINNSGLLSGRFYELSRQIEEKEREHLEILRDLAKQMGAKAIAKPKTKFPLKSQAQIVKLARMIENTGPAAYLGQAPRIRSQSVLAGALAIHTVEARQAAAINVYSGRKASPDGPFAKPLPIEAIVAKVLPFIVDPQIRS
jgi:uncharacterized protein YbjQ (UPF0145 family)